MATKLATKKIEEFGTNIVIPDFNLQTVVFPIIGTNRLVMHKFSEKARKEIEDKQQKKGTSLKAKGKRDPQAEYEACIHYCDDGTPGFPGGGFKKSLVRAAQGLDMKMTEEAIDYYKEAIRIQPDFALAHNNLGNALLQKGTIKEAIDHYRETLRLEPGLVSTQKNLEIALRRSEELDR